MESKIRTPFKMPKLGLGTFLNTDEKTFLETLHEAAKIGYRSIDTAQGYNNEKIIGRFLRETKVSRDEFFITSKLLHQFDTKEETREQIEKSFNDLGIEIIDLYLIHWPSPDYDQNLMTWQVLEEYYSSGRIKNLGVSNFNRHHLLALLPNVSVKPSLNQIEMHPGLNQSSFKEFLDQHNIKTEAYGQFMRGRLFDTPYVTVLEEIAKKYGKSIPQIVIAWGLARDFIMIPKSSNKLRLKENFDAQEIILKKEDIKTINLLSTGVMLYSDPDNNSHYRKKL